MLVEPPRDLVADDVTPWLAARLRQFFDSRYEAQGRSVLVHKFTGWSRARLLHDVFPDAKFIHVYRDGRAVANSFLQMPWWSGHRGPDVWRWGPLSHEDRLAWEKSERSWPVLAAIEWKILIDALRDAEAEIPPRQWLSVKYEELIADPDDWLTRILDFSGLDDDDTFWTRIHRYSLGAGRIEAYRRDLRPEQVEAMEDVIGDRLEALGYELTGPSSESPT
jgi:hypothetical protein